MESWMALLKPSEQYSTARLWKHVYFCKYWLLRIENYTNALPEHQKYLDILGVFKYYAVNLGVGGWGKWDLPNNTLITGEEEGTVSLN